MSTKILILLFCILGYAARAQKSSDPLVAKRAEEVVTKAEKMLKLDDTQVEQFEELEVKYLQSKKSRLDEAWKYTSRENLRYFRTREMDFRKEVEELLSSSQMKKWYAFETKVDPFEI